MTLASNGFTCRPEKEIIIVKYTYSIGRPIQSIFDIGSTILKLRLLKDVQLHPVRFGDSFGCHNLNSVDLMSIFLGFSESLEKNS